MLYSKNFEQLGEENLYELIDQQVAEGFLLEYKRDFPRNNVKLAKSIASFANTYGGHIFLGVEADKVQNRPVEIVGMALENGLKEKVKNIIRDYIQPLPLFRTRLIPLSRLPGRGVLVIHIPESSVTPHFVRGQIYIRTAESAEPIPLSERFAIEKLIEKQKDAKETVRAWLAQRDNGLHAPEIEHGYWLSFICTPAVVNEALIPVFKENFWDFLRKTVTPLVGGIDEITQNSFLHFVDRKTPRNLPPEFMEVCTNGLVEYAVEGNKAEARKSLSKSWVNGKLVQFLRAVREIYLHPAVDYYGELNLVIALNRIKGVHYIIHEPLNGSFVENSQAFRKIFLLIRREIDVPSLESNSEEILDSINREIYRSFGVKVFEK